MKKASKILTLILIVVFVLSVFAGCDLIGRNTAKYRATTAMMVGDQKITVGKLLDTFNSYYNNYYYYISAGYLTADSLMEMVVNSLLRQYMQIDDYVKDTNNIQTPDLKGVITNAEYLSREQFEYCIKYVKHSSFTTFDGTVLETLSVKHEIGNAKTEDTSRDFAEYDELYSKTSYAEHVLLKNFQDEDADEYFTKYYPNMEFSSVQNLVDGYVYKTEADAKAILDELNERLEDDEDEITFAEYVDAQQKALDKYADTIQNNYEINLQKFMEDQVADMVSSCILSLWSYQYYKDLDVKEIVKNADIALAEDQEVRFAFNDDFDSFITGLTDTSVIYNVPDGMLDKYVFVKNILIPFTSEQSALLKAHSDSYGGTDTPGYEKLRNDIATEIAAEYFYSDKYNADIEKVFEDTGLLKDNDDEDSDSKYQLVEHIFTIKDGKIAIDPDGILGQFFGDNGKVNKMEGTESEAETIVELMKRFNTDVGQHSTRYDYVVYVGDDWEDYSHSWVEEFYTAVNELRSDSGVFEGVGKYAMCVSTYGVHIIYVDSYVNAEKNIYKYKDIEWDNAESWNDTSSLSYVRYKAEFDKQVTELTQKAFNELQAKYLKNDSLITVTKYFKRFLKDNEFTFDLAEFKKEQLEELDVD